MVDHVYADFDKRTQGNVRKALRGSVFFALPSVAAITTISVDSVGSPGTPTLNTLPVGYTDIGFLSDAGAVLAEAVTSVDVAAWGDLEPVRRDITADVTTVQLVALEVNKQALATYFGVNPTSLTADATTAEVSVVKPSSTTSFFWRVLVLGVDQTDAGEIYIARFLPNACVTNKGNMTFADSGDGINFDCTLTAYKDSTLGYADKMFFGGPGWKPIKTQMGF